MAQEPYGNWMVGGMSEQEAMAAANADKARRVAEGQAQGYTGEAPGKKDAGPPPDYVGAVEKSTQANRPNQTNAFGSTVNWTKGSDGQWNQTQQFGGMLGGLASGLQGQVANSFGQPMDWSQFGKLGTGDDARNQTIEASYGQATSRLNPQWAQRDESLSAQLANQGLDPQTSAAGRMAMLQQSQAKNDAYGSAMNSAIMQGQAAGDSVFRNNMAARDQSISEALRKRAQPFGELSGLSSLLGQQGFMGGPSYLQAAQMLGEYQLGQSQRAGSVGNSIAGGFGGLLGGIGSFF